MSLAHGLIGALYALNTARHRGARYVFFAVAETVLRRLAYLPLGAVHGLNHLADCCAERARNAAPRPSHPRGRA